MIEGPIFNTILGAGIKLGSNVVNHLIEKSSRSQELAGADAAARLDAQTRIIEENAKSPFVQFTRRVLFLTLTFTFCWVVIYFTQHPDVDWTVYPEAIRRFGFLSYLFGSNLQPIHAGALLVSAFVDLMFMVVGFYSIRSNRK